MQFFTRYEELHFILMTVKTNHLIHINIYVYILYIYYIYTEVFSYGGTKTSKVTIVVPQPLSLPT